MKSKPEAPHKASFQQLRIKSNLHSRIPVLPLVITSVLSLFFLTTASVVGPPLQQFGFALAFAVWPLLIVLNELGIFSVRSLRWNETSIWLHEKAGNKTIWEVSWPDLATVQYGDQSHEVILLTSDSRYLTGALNEDDLMTLAVILGQHLVETEQTEVARPFFQIDGSAENIKKSYVRLALFFIVPSASFVIALTLLKNMMLWTLLAGPLLAPLAVLAVVLPIVGICDLRRTVLASKVPKLADVNRDVELEIYDEFGEDSDAAARFFRHVWHHRNANGWKLLPKATRKRLLHKANQLDKSQP